MLDQISIVIIVRDAERTLARTLDSVTRFSEVVVYDNGSADSTPEIAQGYPNVTFHRGPFLGFGPTKMQAVGLARNAWILALDADEVIPPELVDELQAIRLDPDVAYALLRVNYCMGRPVRHSGWGADWLIRLFHRDHYNFDDAPVHEKVALPPGAPRRRLRSPFIHYAVEDLGQFLAKVNSYSEIRRQTSSKTYPAAIIALKAGFAFFRTFVLQGGILDGWRGLVISWSNANGVFFKYMKIYADKQQ